MTKYATPAAFRRALTDKLRALSQGSKWTLPQLRRQFAYDLADWFRFEIGPRRTVGDESSAVRLPVTGYIGQQEWERFHIDLVGSDLRMTGEPDYVPPIAQVDIPELQQKGYRAYPLVDHVADKIAATSELYGPSRQSNCQMLWIRQ